MNRNIECLRGVIMAFMVVCCMGAAYGVERNWQGLSDDWHDAGNWMPEGVPGLGDIATIPSLPEGGRFSSVTSGDAFCQGLIIQTEATVEVGSDVGLYIVAPRTLNFESQGVYDTDETVALTEYLK